MIRSGATSVASEGLQLPHQGPVHIVLSLQHQPLILFAEISRGELAICTREYYERHIPTAETDSVVEQPDIRSERELSEEPASSYGEDADMMSHEDGEDGRGPLQTLSAHWLTRSFYSREQTASAGGARRP